jgi:hypothetical protein
VFPSPFNCVKTGYFVEWHATWYWQRFVLLVLRLGSVARYCWLRHSRPAFPALP